MAGLVGPEWLEALRRQSGLGLDTEGRWHFGTGWVENERVQELFHAGVEVREDGEVILRVGEMWCYVKCPGPAYFVRKFRWMAGEVVLAGGRVLPLRLRRVGWGPDERLYVWLDGVRGPAICLRQAHQDAIARLVEAGGEVRLEHGAGLSVAVEVLDAVPGPSSAAG